MPPDAELQFRAPAPMRMGLALVGTMSGIAAGVALWSFAGVHDWPRFLLAWLLLLPAFLALSIAPKSYVLGDSYLEIRLPGSRRRIPFASIRAVDERRGSLSLETRQGPVSLSWLGPGERLRFRKALVERARLIPSVQEAPYGVLARYVPRSQDVTFVPHHGRRSTPPDSGGMVSSG